VFPHSIWTSFAGITNALFHTAAATQPDRQQAVGRPGFWAGLAAALVLIGAQPSASLASGATSPVRVSPLITPSELKPLVERKSVRVLDIRELFQNDGKTPNYDAGHIPGAVAAPYSSIRGPEANPGEVISDKELSELLQQWGIDRSTHVVIAHTGADGSDFGGAARFYWTLKLAGIQRISILDGGLGAWGALKYPLETAAPKITPSQIQVSLDKRQIPTTAQIASLIQERNAGKKKFILSDSRPEDYFLGTEKHSAAARAGTLPGAKNFDHEEWFQLNTGKLLPKSQLESLAKSAGLISNDDIISFCNTGHWSATTWFVLSEILGQPNVRMYPESTIAWSKSRNPMDNEPARGKVLMNQLKDAVSNLKK
jgi:thiosulfate/3-mercaptopyruvate sulfurtransferase